jgi:hypothetical protein
MWEIIQLGPRPTPNFVRAMKERRIRWTTEEMRNVHKPFVGQPKVRDLFKDMYVDDRIILTRILRKGVD